MTTADFSDLVNRIDFVETTGSTNADLISTGTNLPDFTVLVADFQSAGKGRSGRDWVAPPLSSLFVSVLLKPTEFGADKFSWMPLLAGLAMSETVSHFLAGNPDQASETAGATPKSVGLKWPNDVLVNDKKISGVLSELLPDLSGVVIGAGLNISQAPVDLPIEAATSLHIETQQKFSRNDVLRVYLENLSGLYAALKAAAGDPIASGLKGKVDQRCITIGREVRVILPGNQELFGRAVAIDDTGRLLVQPSNGQELFAVSAGDIVHLRHSSL